MALYVLHAKMVFYVFLNLKKLNLTPMVFMVLLKSFFAISHLFWRKEHLSNYYCFYYISYIMYDKYNVY